MAQPILAVRSLFAQTQIANENPVSQIARSDLQYVAIARDHLGQPLLFARATLIEPIVALRYG